MTNVISYSELRQKLKAIMDKTSKEHEPTIIQRKNGSNLVLIDEEDYRIREESLHLFNSQKNMNRILEACTRDPKERLQFNTVEELENEVRNRS